MIVGNQSYSSLLLPARQSMLMLTKFLGIIICVAIYSIEGGGYTVFDSHARDMYGNSHSEVTYVLLEIPSMHKLEQHFQSLFRIEDIYELKDVRIANFEVDFFSSSVEYFIISNVNIYQCSCKQCCAIAVYAMCYSVINLCGLWTSGTYPPLLVTGIHYTM